MLSDNNRLTFYILIYIKIHFALRKILRPNAATFLYSLISAWHSARFSIGFKLLFFEDDLFFRLLLLLLFAWLEFASNISDNRGILCQVQNIIKRRYSHEKVFLQTYHSFNTWLWWLGFHFLTSTNPLMYICKTESLHFKCKRVV